MQQLTELAENARALAERLTDGDPEGLATIRAEQLAEAAETLADYGTVLVGAIAEAFRFVAAELDPHPGAWADYVADPQRRAVLLELEAAALSTPAGGKG